MKYKVHGYCLVPTEAELEVEADSPEDAVSKAQAIFRRRPQDLIVSQSSDDFSAYDWQPTAREISSV